MTDDSVAITFDVPERLQDDYAFTHGQHLTIRTELAGDDVRRNYSICSPAGSGVLRVAVKRLPGGAFSEHALDALKPGDVLDVMTPTGRFFTELDPGTASTTPASRPARASRRCCRSSRARWRPSRSRG